MLGLLCILKEISSFWIHFPPSYTFIDIDNEDTCCIHPFPPLLYTQYDNTRAIKVGYDNWINICSCNHSSYLSSSSLSLSSRVLNDSDMKAMTKFSNCPRMSLHHFKLSFSLFHRSSSPHPNASSLQIVLNFFVEFKILLIMHVMNSSSTQFQIQLSHDSSIFRKSQQSSIRKTLSNKKFLPAFTFVR